MAQTAFRGALRRPRPLRQQGALLALALGLGLLTAAPARAEQAFVRGEVRLNLRTGPGTQFRIQDVVTTGDQLEVLQRGDGWTQVRLPGGTAGWIPEGYLQPEPPPGARLEQLETQVVELQQRLEETTRQARSLREENQAIAQRDDQQQAEIERLTMENLELTAGARWPEWITGASILGVGMLLGALLHRNATRRPSTRIRI